MPFIRGIIFSSELLDGCQSLRDQLQMLHWGGLHLAVLIADAASAANTGAGADTEAPHSAAAGGQAPAATSLSGSGAGGRYGCEALSVLHLQLRPTAPEGGVTAERLRPVGQPGPEEVANGKHDEARAAVAAAAEAAAAAWAAGLGLLWPEEVLVLAAAGDGAASALRRRLLQQQHQNGNDEVLGNASGTLEEELGVMVLPGIALGHVGGNVEAAPWQRLRLALAHANLQRALAGVKAGAVVEAKEVGARGPEDAEGTTGPAGGSMSPAATTPPLLVVGTAMKPSRERDLAKEGLLNLVPMEGLVFAPLDLSLPLEQQLPFHAILHKASDELEDGEDGVPRFGPRVRALAEFVSRQGPPGVSLVDPLEAAAKVINRTELARVCDSLSLLDLTTNSNLDNDQDLDLGSLHSAAVTTAAITGTSAPPPPPGPHPFAYSGNGDGGAGASSAGGSGGSGRQGAASTAAASASLCAKRQRIEGRVMGNLAEAEAEAEAEVGNQGQVGVKVRVRAPRSTTVSAFSSEEVAAAIKRLGCPPPYIVKPVVACGTPDSHSMALVLREEALEGLGLPLPAVIQEFVNHDATIFKVYVAGDKVFHTVRPSIPNIPQNPSEALQLAPRGALLFDSLKSLPTSLRPLQAAQDGSAATSAAAAPARAAAVAAVPAVRRPSQVVLERLAAHLRAELGLSLFGFDVVVEAAAGAAGPTSGSACAGGDGSGNGGDKGSEEDANGNGGGGGNSGGEKEQLQPQHQELVVVDVNYFPSYRGAEGAPKLFRAAVRQAHERQQRGQL